MKKIYLPAILFLIINSTFCIAQLTPVAVTGASFNQDIVANGTGGNAVTVTSTAIDAANYILYTQQFLTATEFSGGGLPNNGTIVNGMDTYQLQDYASNNAIFFEGGSSGSSRNINLITPKAYTQLSLAAFSTSGNCSISLVVHYTDDTDGPLINTSVSDWFEGTPFIIKGIGRITRDPFVEGVSALPENPRIYQVNVTVNSAKNIQSITVTNNTSNESTTLSIVAVSGVEVAALPIDFASFKGSYQDNLKCAVLNWDAYNTAGTAKFEVERSDEGVQFTKLGDVIPISSNDKSSYSYHDYSASNTKSYYYRIKQVQQSGQVIYTTLIKIVGVVKSVLKLSQSASLITVMNLSPQGSYEYSLMNGGSVLVKKGIFTGNVHSINISSLAKGLYILTIKVGSGNQTMRFIK